MPEPMTEELRGENDRLRAEIADRDAETQDLRDQLARLRARCALAADAIREHMNAHDEADNA